MATIEEVKVLTPVQDLKEGDVIDLAGDEFADEEDFGVYDHEYAVVQYVSSYGKDIQKPEENPTTTAVEFMHDTLEDVAYFPYGHLVNVVTAK